MPIHIAYNVISAEHVLTHEGSSYSVPVTVMSSSSLDSIKLKFNVHKYFPQPALFSLWCEYCCRSRKGDLFPLIFSMSDL